MPTRRAVGQAVFDHDAPLYIDHPLGIMTSRRGQVRDVGVKVLATLRTIMGVSHLLHMAFFPGLYDSRGQLCLVNPTMQSRTCLQLAVLPHWAESRSCAWQVCKVACL